MYLEDIVLRLAAVALNKHPDKITPDAPLFYNNEGFDSIAMVEFVLHLESKFGISIPDHDLDMDIFYSVNTVAAYINSRLIQGS